MSSRKLSQAPEWIPPSLDRDQVAFQENIPQDTINIISAGWLKGCLHSLISVKSWVVLNYETNLKFAQQPVDT